MAGSIDEIGIEYIENDKVIVKEVKKNILTRGNWTTIMFLYQEMDKKTEDYGPLKVSIRRYQKRNGIFRQQSKFNISNEKQAREIASTLVQWFDEATSDESLASVEIGAS